MKDRSCLLGAKDDVHTLEIQVYHKLDLRLLAVQALAVRVMLDSKSPQSRIITTSLLSTRHSIVQQRKIHSHRFEMGLLGTGYMLHLHIHSINDFGHVMPGHHLAPRRAMEIPRKVHPTYPQAIVVGDPFAKLHQDLELGAISNPIYHTLQMGITGLRLSQHKLRQLMGKRQPLGELMPQVQSQLSRLQHRQPFGMSLTT
jgi:hypothetical protein